MSIQRWWLFYGPRIKKTGKMSQLNRQAATNSSLPSVGRADPHPMKILLTGYNEPTTKFLIRAEENT
jgi:hypothetical protein